MQGGMPGPPHDTMQGGMPGPPQGGGGCMQGGMPGPPQGGGGCMQGGMPGPPQGGGGCMQGGMPGPPQGAVPGCPALCWPIARWATRLKARITQVAAPRTAIFDRIDFTSAVPLSVPSAAKRTTPAATTPLAGSLAKTKRKERILP
jgi:hypothetical protein